MAKWLMHAYNPPKDSTIHPGALHLQLDTHWFIIPPFEPFEVESDYYAHHLMAIYGPVYGLIELPTTRTKTGIIFDPEEGLHRAKVYFRECQESSVLQYARIQMEDRVRSNLPTLPPTGFVLEAIKELGIDLQQRFGFTPMGWDRSAIAGKTTISDGRADVSLAAQSAAADVIVLRRENDELKAKFDRLQDTLEALLANQQAAADSAAKKGK